MIDMKRFGKSVFFVTFIALVTAFFAGTAMAVGYTWDNDSGNGMWKDVNNWNPNGNHPGNGPGPVDTATFDVLGGNITVAAPFGWALMALNITTNNPVTIQFPGGAQSLARRRRNSQGGRQLHRRKTTVRQNVGRIQSRRWPRRNGTTVSEDRR